MIDAAIVGLGRWGQALVESVQQNSDRIRFVRAVTRTPDNAEAFIRRTNLTVDVDMAATLKDPTVAAVVLATPHSQHADQIIAAAQAGKHVFVEKPFALNKASAELALRACEQAGVTVGVGFNRRFLPSFAELKRRLESGQIGTLMHVEGIFSVNIVSDVGAWRRFASESPAGGMTSLGIHVLDLMIAVASEVTDVTAMSHRRAISWDIDDTTAVLSRHASGASGYLCTVAQGARLFMLRAYGSKGWLEMRGEQQLVMCSAPPTGMGGEESQVSYEPFNTLKAELETFAEAIRSKRPFPISPQQIVNGIAALEAIQTSSAERRAVTVA